MTSQGISSTKNSMLFKRKDPGLNYKTHLCINFKRFGRCNYGDSCIFIHASQDAKVLPPQGQWKENFSDAKRLKSQNMVAGNTDAARLCRWFSSGEVCPYGFKCNFLHERLERRPYGDVGAITRSDAIRVEDSNSGPRSPCLRQTEWKTKLCHKWSMNNFCPYGSRCSYAHGKAELRDNCSSQRMRRDPTLKMVTTTDLTLPTSRKEAIAESIMHQQLAKKWGFDWEQGRKIVGIYADWIDDLLVSF